jgi:hypothetical protein
LLSIARASWRLQQNSVQLLNRQPKQVVFNTTNPLPPIQYHHSVDTNSCLVTIRHKTLSGPCYMTHSVHGECWATGSAQQVAEWDMESIIKPNISNTAVGARIAQTSPGNPCTTRTGAHVVPRINDPGGGPASGVSRYQSSKSELSSSSAAPSTFFSTIRWTSARICGR